MLTIQENREPFITPPRVKVNRSRVRTCKILVKLYTLVYIGSIRIAKPECAKPDGLFFPIHGCGESQQLKDDDQTSEDEE